MDKTLLEARDIKATIVTFIVVTKRNKSPTGGSA